MAKLLDLSVYGPGHISNILQVDASVYAMAFVTDGGKNTQVVRGDGTLASISSLSVGNADTVDNKHASDFALLKTWNDLIHSSNEFTFVSPGYAGGVWFNYRTSSGNTDGSINQYYFGDGKGGLLAYISNGYFSGKAESAGSVPWSGITDKPSTFAPSTHSHDYLPLSGGTMTGSPYINFPASANSTALTDNTPTGLTYGRLQSYGTMTICGDTGGSTTEYVNITAGYSVANATAANGLSIGYSTLKWKGNTIWHAGNDGAGSGLDADTLDSLNSTSFAIWRGDANTDSTTSDTTSTSTADFFAKINATSGLFNSRFGAMRGSWWYVGNTQLDTGVGTLEMAGTAVLNLGSYADTNDTYKSLLFLDQGGRLWSYTANETAVKQWSRYAKTTDIKDPANYYWANVKVSSSSNAATTPTFGNITTENILPKTSNTYNIGSNGNEYSTGDIRIVYTRHIDSARSFTGDTNLYIQYLQKGNTLMQVNGGNVGIGTASPTHKLHVAGSAKIGGNLLIGADSSTNYIAFHGTTGDNPGSYNHTYIGENIWGTPESSELVLFKGNDIGTSATTVTSSGADRIRHIAAAHLFQIYKSVLSGTFDTVCKSTVPVNMLAIHQGSIETYALLNVGGALNVNGGADLNLRASSATNTDPGDLVFANSSGTELARLWKPSANDLYVRFGSSDSSKTILHSGNFTTHLNSTYVNVTGDTMTGALTLPANGLIVNSAGGDTAKRVIKAYGSAASNSGVYYLNFGDNPASGNCGEIGFTYAGSGSTSNKIAMGFYGGNYLTYYYNGSNPGTLTVGTTSNYHTVLTSGNTYVTGGHGVINGTTITQVANADTLDGEHGSRYTRALGSPNNVTFVVGGNADTYYPVVITSVSDYYPMQFVNISRTYSETAPDTWNTSTHRGGLTLTLLWNGSRYWDGNTSGGACYCVYKNETYSTMVGGLGNCTAGKVVWLRGGGAHYHLHSMNGTSASATVYTSTYTDSASQSFAPKTSPDGISVRWPGYAQGADYATSAGNADTLDGYHYNSFAWSSHSHSTLETYFKFVSSDVTEAAVNLSTSTTAHTMTFYRNGISIPYQMDNPNDGGLLRVRGTTESNVIYEMATWDDSGGGETIQFNYYPTTSASTPTYSVSVPKKSGTIALTSDIPASSNYASAGHTHTSFGSLTLTGDLNLSAASGNDSGDIVWKYTNGNEKSRIWTDNVYTSGIGPNYRVYNESGTALYTGRLATVGEVAAKVSKAGDTMTGVLNTCSTPGTWVSGMSGAAIQYNSLTAIDGNSFWRFFNMKSQSGHVVCYGGLGNNIGFYGYYAGRTANSCDWSFLANTTNGVWTASSSIYAASFYENSDLRLKKDITSVSNSYNTPQIKEFRWKSDNSKSYGLIAQELEAMGYTELVSVKDDGYKVVDYSAAHSLIIGKLQLKIKELEDRIKYLESK